MPAAAVIPAPIAYTKVVAVKKLVVEIRRMPVRSTKDTSVSLDRRTFTVKKLECSKQA